MEAFVHILLFLFSSAVIWFFAGILVESVNRIALKFHRTGFTVAFFVLGFLTSISELAVAVNSVLEEAPQISAGNLAGASFVILLFLIPFLAVIGNGIGVQHTLSQRNLLFALLAILLPIGAAIDGSVTRGEGVLALLVYITLLFAIRGQKDSLKTTATIEKHLGSEINAWTDILKVVIGGAFIFIAGHFLVEQAIYFAEILDVPRSIVGLILLSVGTNVPEIVLAARAIRGNHRDIAFGNYVGSAAANTLVFGILAVLSGTFRVEASVFLATGTLMLAGLTAFFFFAQSNHRISRPEGAILLLFYGAFLVFQILNGIRIAAN